MSLTTVFVDNALDVIRSFHRDEQKAQLSELRGLAKTAATERENALATGLQINPRFVVDTGREFGLQYLIQQYGEDTVQKALGR